MLPYPPLRRLSLTGVGRIGLMVESHYGLSDKNWQSLKDALGKDAEGLIQFFAVETVGRKMLNRKVNRRKDPMVQIGVRRNDDGRRLAIVVEREVALDLLRAAIYLGKELHPSRGLKLHE